MTDENPVEITFEEFTDPVVAYVENGEPRITAQNGAFESVFETISTGAPVASIFEHFGVGNSTGKKEPVVHLTRVDNAGIYLDGFGEVWPFFARILPAGPETGCGVFSDLNECLDIVETPAIDQVSTVISHNLRNPLDVAKAHLRAARESGDVEHFDAVADAHERMK